MSAAKRITPGTKVEKGTLGTASHKVGLVLGSVDTNVLGREDEDPAVLVAWSTGEQEWIEVSLLRALN